MFSKEVIQFAVKYRINKEIFYGKSYIDFNKDIEKKCKNEESSIEHIVKI